MTFKTSKVNELTLKKFVFLIAVIILIIFLLKGSFYFEFNFSPDKKFRIGNNQPKNNAISDLSISIPVNKYPETAQHVKDAILKGESSICTIDRNGAESRRYDSLKGIPTKEGYDRDEYPPAMCVEGGEGADIRYITPSDNRGAGSWMGHQLSEYPDGTKIEFKN